MRDTAKMMDREARKELIYKHLEKPYRKLIKRYMALGDPQEIEQEMLAAGLNLPEVVQMKLPIITDKMSNYTVGNQLWNRTTGILIKVISVILGEHVPNALNGDFRNDAPILSDLVDINTLVCSQLAIENPDFRKMCGVSKGFLGFFKKNKSRIKEVRVKLKILN